MVSFPVAQVTSLQLGEAVLTSAFAWNPSSGAYQMVDLQDVTSLDRDQGTGRGFWVYATEASEIQFVGWPNSGAWSDPEVSLGAGWNLLGFPYQKTQAFAQVQVRHPDGTLNPLPDAVSSQIPPATEDAAFHQAGFTYQDQSYRPASLADPAGTFQVGKAMWVYAHRDRTSLVYAGSSAWLRFDPLAPDLPLPMDLARDPATGRNRIPGTGEPYDSLNSLQGWSTSGPLILNFNALVDAASVNDFSVMLCEAESGSPLSTRLEVKNLAPDRSTVLIRPLRPLEPAHRYLVVLTGDITSGGRPIIASRAAELLKHGSSLLKFDGTSAIPGLSDDRAQALEAMRLDWREVWSLAEGATLQSRFELPFAWTFTTQPLLQTLPVLRARIQGQAVVPVVTGSYVGPTAVDAFYFSKGLGAVPHGDVAAVYAGYFMAPNYLSDATDGPFQGPPGTPVPVGTTRVPFLALRGPGTAAGTVLFGHGISRSKSDALVLANAANARGLGVVAIDSVLHGERALPGQASGTGFVNLDNILMSRDNIRQTVSDLCALSRMVGTGNTDFDGDQVPDLATGAQVYVGQSLGGIIGTAFVAVEPNVRLATMNVAGARISQLMLDSTALRPVVLAAARVLGFQPGTEAFDQYLWAIQTVLDDADPFNYAPGVLPGTLKGGVPTSVLVQEMLGDLVVPNAATDDLVRAMGIDLVQRTNPAENQVPFGVRAVRGPAVGSGLFQYVKGQHGFLLDPFEGPTQAAQEQALTHALSGIATAYGGATVTVPVGQRADLPTWRFPFELFPEGFVWHR